MREIARRSTSYDPVIERLLPECAPTVLLYSRQLTFPLLRISYSVWFYPVQIVSPNFGRAVLGVLHVRNGRGTETA